jgi:hypothetical protein
MGLTVWMSLKHRDYKTNKNIITVTIGKSVCRPATGFQFKTLTLLECNRAPLKHNLTVCEIGPAV